MTILVSFFFSFFFVRRTWSTASCAVLPRPEERLAVMHILICQLYLEHNSLGIATQRASVTIQRSGQLHSERKKV